MHIMGLLLLDDNTMPGAGALAAFGASTFIFGIIFLVLALVINWRIASKAGYPGWYSLGMLIPLVNLILLIVFAFVEWPVERAARGGRSMAPTA